jgi:NPCBM/NEW2 domain
LPHGVVISGKWQDLDTSTWKIESAWGQALSLPAGEIQGVRFAGGKMSYLSDLIPSKVEETPFFGHRLSWRKDVSLMGQPLRMKGRTYARGVAVHSRCALTYDLGGKYSTFEAMVGFDDSAKARGHVDCRVFADGKEIYANPDLSASGLPAELKLPVAGADQLRLLVDFGRGQDTGDRVIWANARLYRPSPKTAASREPANDAGQPITSR